jgi:hypothetical protein
VTIVVLPVHTSTNLSSADRSAEKSILSKLSSILRSETNKHDEDIRITVFQIKLNVIQKLKNTKKDTIYTTKKKETVTKLLHYARGSFQNLICISPK